MILFNRKHLVKLVTDLFFFYTFFFFLLIIPCILTPGSDVITYFVSRIILYLVDTSQNGGCALTKMKDNAVRMIILILIGSIESISHVFCEMLYKR